MTTDINSMPLLTAEEEVTLAQRIEAGIYAEHLLVAGCPDYAASSELWTVRADGKAAWTDFFHANLRMAAQVANRWAVRFHVEADDIMQECFLALMGAIMSWDWARGTRFSTLAWPRLMMAAESACWRRASGGQSPVWWMRDHSEKRQNWSPPRHLTDLDDSAVLVDHGEDKAYVRGRLEMLPDLDRTIIERHYGLQGTPTTYVQLAKDLRMSARSVKRLEARALAAMADDRELRAA